MCKKYLVATDCMEYDVVCEVLNTNQYIGLLCECGDCRPVCERTNELTICPSCGGPLIEGGWYEDNPPSS